MRWALLVGLGLSGCVTLFDLEPTEDSATDLDADGVSDLRDNCAGVVNSDQADEDGDRFGDVCDPLSCPFDGQQVLSVNRDIDRDGVDDGCDICLTGPNDDEDGDGAADGCDVCPFTADAQADADNDFVGDPCDPSSSPDRRILSDGFASSNPLAHSWVDPGWRFEAGAMLPDGMYATTQLGTKAVNAPSQSPWSISIGLDLGASGGMSLSLEDDTIGTYVCSLTYSDTDTAYRLSAWYLPLPLLVDAGPTLGDLVAGQQTVTLRLRIDAVTHAMICETGEVTVSSSEVSVPTLVSLTAQPGIKVTHVDVIQ